MDLNVIAGKLCDEMTAELENVDYYNQRGNPEMACFCSGYADGLRHALALIELLQETKKATMPASTAAIP